MPAVGEDELERGPVFLHALRSAVARPPVWGTCWAMIALLALLGALPWHAFFEGAMEREHPGAQVAWLTEVFRFDHREELDALEASSAAGGAVLAFLAMLVGCFCAGGWLQVVLERTEGHSQRRFFFGGARFFWRFVRVLVMALVVLGAGAWMIYGKPWELVVDGFLLGVSDREELVTEAGARRLEWFQHGFFAVWMALVVVWSDYVRARLAMHEARSAIWAGIATVGTLFGSPLRILRPALLLFLCEFAVLWAIGLWTRSIDASIGPATGMATFWMLGLLVQLALVWRTIVRGAHLYAAVRIGREVIEPPAKPDPWRNRIGGPGGPQYPLGDDDYGVSF